MKTKIAILLLSALALVTFTGLRSISKASSDRKYEPKSYQSQGGQLMTDQNQFN